MTQLTDNGIFSISIPADATDIVLHNDPPKLVFSSEIQDPAQCGGDMIVLPPGSYEFLFCTESATEEDARKVVEKDDRGYKHYWEDKGFVPRGFNGRYKTAIESLRSLLRSKGCEGDWAVVRELK